MPYPASHKESSRRRILESAVRLFAANGYDGVTLDQLMQDAELTRGAFYAHFDSKQSLYAEAVLHAACRGPLAALDGAMTGAALKDMIREYLDMSHVRLEGAPCPLAFLATDAAARQTEVRDAYTRVYKAMIGRVLALPMVADKDAALAISALMIGSVVVARALDDEDLSQQLLDACYQASERLI
jgi:TetR/AcrR family transcriptional repressor of nem operon